MTVSGTQGKGVKASEDGADLVYAAGKKNADTVKAGALKWQKDAELFDGSDGYDYSKVASIGTDGFDVTYGDGVPETLAPGDSMTLLKANATLKDMAAAEKTSSYSFKPISGVTVDAAVTGKLAVKDGVLTYTTAENRADKLTFGDQYYAANGTILPTTVESFDSDNRTFFDFSVGASYVYEGRLNVGFAVFHVSRPDNGFVEGSQFLERKYVAQVNFSQDLELNRGLMSSPGSDNYFFANAAYQNQDCFNQVMLGAGVCFQPMIFGVTWKTNITKVFETASAEKETEEGTADTGVYFTAVNIPSLMVGAYYKGLQVYYIFDFNISAKKNGSWSNELSLIYTLPNKKKDLCPVTYW